MTYTTEKMLVNSFVAVQLKRIEKQPKFDIVKRSIAPVILSGNH